MASRTTEEEEIRQLIEGWAEAVRARDVDGRMSGLAPGIVAFDVVDPIRMVGVDAVRRRLEGWFGSLQGPLGLELRDLTVAASGEVAFAHALVQVRGTTRDGRSLEMWWRETLGFRKLDGRWQAVHAHDSVPFDPATGLASVGLRP